MSKIIVANWKMGPSSIKEAEALIKKISISLKKIKNIKVTVCPPFVFLSLFKKLKTNQIIFGAQDVSSNIAGSYTGEVSSQMLNSVGVKQVIVGHSECRSRGDNNEIVNKKILNLLKNQLTPILCIGENKRDSEGFYLSFINDQIVECLKNVSSSKVKNIIIAYEPVWAIGSNAVREATPDEFIEMKIFIKKILSDLYNPKIAQQTLILYGGSVNEDNASCFINDGGADGLLIGRNSLNSKKFDEILKSLN